MPRHSKNNTAGSVFTYHETKSLDYGTKRVRNPRTRMNKWLTTFSLFFKARLGRESFRDFDACYLCLQTAREPVACSKGHLACRECYYESYLQQKQDIKREQALLDQKLANLDDRKQQDEAAAKQALLDQFERTQTSVLGQRKNIRGGDDDQGKPSNTNMTTAPNSQQDGAGKRNLLCLLFFLPYSLLFSISLPLGRVGLFSRHKAEVGANRISRRQIIQTETQVQLLAGKFVADHRYTICTSHC